MQNRSGTAPDGPIERLAALTGPPPSSVALLAVPASGTLSHPDRVRAAPARLGVLVKACLAHSQQRAPTMCAGLTMATRSSQHPSQRDPAWHQQGADHPVP